jgi:epoxyqueuosine reductase
MAPENRQRRVLEHALEAGFDLAGLIPLGPPRDAQRFETWLGAGRQAGMDWFERTRERILDPRRIDADARSLLVVGLGHARPRVELRGGGRIARYAAGRDYHNVMTRRLRKLARLLEGEGLTGAGRAVVDAGPLLERSHAAQAGLGFASKAANLLHPRFGPWYFLGELLLDLEVAPEAVPPAPPTGSCGTCTACLDACPTGALVEPGVLDARLCLSYHTIENRGTIPHELRPGLGDWLFGCDVCSEVCPWGHEAEQRAAAESGAGGPAPWGTHDAVLAGGLVDWLRRPPEELRAALVGSPLQRTGTGGLARNAALVLGNRPREEGRTALEEALEEDPRPTVRAASFWALARGHGADGGVRGVLERALAREEDEICRADMRRSLEECRARSGNRTSPEDASRSVDTLDGTRA